jgi:hypothetical protein
MRSKSSTSSEAQSAAALQHTLWQCSDLLERQLPPLVEGALQRVDDALSELADKAESDRSYASYHEGQRRLRREQAHLKRRFLRNLTDTMALFQETPQRRDLAADARFDPEELELVGDRDLEESLVLTNMISKAESRYYHSLRDLARHFASILGRPSLPLRDLPVGPTAIANAFAASLRAVDDLELSTVLVVHKIFDQQVMDQLDAFYTGCVEFALTQGLKPRQRKHEIVKNDEPGPSSASADSPQPADTIQSHRSMATGEDAGVHPPGRPTPTGGTGAGLALDGPESQGNNLGGALTPGTETTFAALRQMLAGARQISAASASLATIATNDLIALLSGVQPHATQQNAPGTALAPSELRQAVDARLRASMDPGGPRRLAPNDEDTMDLVFLLFEQILAGDDMPDAIKVLVSRLQIPYVKVALTDDRFFDDVEHPARRLLNRIGAASIGWNDGEQQRDDGFYALVRHIVERAVTEAQGGAELFDLLDRRLAKHVADQQSHAAGAERRFIQKAAARNARQRARQHANALIDARVQDRSALPPVVQTILDDAWLEAMVQAHANGGEQDRHWQLGQSVLSDLLWSVAPKRDAAERRELLRRIPELLRDLRACLATVIPDQQLLARWLKELQTVHISALRGGSSDARLPGELSGDGRPLPDAVPDIGDADALPIGCWLGIAADDGRIQRFRLAWRGEAGDPLVFVDRLGRRGFELPKPELEALLAQDLAVVIGTGEVPIVDRAMEAVRQSLSVH